MKNLNKIFCIGVLFHYFFIPLCGIAQINEVNQTIDAKIDVSIKDKVPVLTKYIQEARKLWKVPGVSVAIIEKGQVYYINDGVTTVGTNNPVTEDSVFCIMSCTKIVTVILLHQLEDEGKINLNDPVIKYLPWFKLSDPEATQKVKIHHLISHCVGLPPFSADTLWHLNFSQKEIIEKLTTIPMKYQPGEKYAYQNICFGIAGMLIEKILNQPFSEIVQQRIFQKLDMNNSSVGPQNTTLWNRLLQKLKQFFNLSSPSPTNSKKTIAGHKKLNNQIVPIYVQQVPYLFNGTSGINSTTSDYIKLIACLNHKGIIQFGPHKGEKLFSEKGWKSMSALNIPLKNQGNNNQFPTQRIIKNSFYYGQGMFRMRYGDDSCNALIHFHMGANVGWRTFWLIVPSAQIGVVIFSNLGSINTSLLPEVIAYKISDLYLQLEEYDWNQNKYNIFQKEKSDDSYQLTAPYPISFSLLLGTYHSDLYGDLKISSLKDKLYLNYRDKTVKLSHISDGRFSFKSQELSSKYSDDDNDMIIFEGSDKSIRSFVVFREDVFKKVK